MDRVIDPLSHSLIIIDSLADSFTRLFIARFEQAFQLIPGSVAATLRIPSSPTLYFQDVCLFARTRKETRVESVEAGEAV
jgi:hypothetical protein